MDVQLPIGPGSGLRRADAIRRAVEEACDARDAELSALRAFLRVAIAGQRYEQALTLYEELACFGPAEPRLHLRRGHLLARLGRREEAAAAFRRAAELYGPSDRGAAAIVPILRALVGDAPERPADSVDSVDAIACVDSVELEVVEVAAEAKTAVGPEPEPWSDLIEREPEPARPVPTDADVVELEIEELVSETRLLDATATRRYPPVLQEGSALADLVRRCARVFAWRKTMERPKTKSGSPAPKKPVAPAAPRRFVPVTEALTRRYPALAAPAAEEHSSVRIKIDEDVTELDVDDIELMTTPPPAPSSVGSAA